MPPKRPLGVTLSLWMVLCISAWGLIRILAAVRWWSVLIEFGASLHPLYLSLTGAGWALAGAVLFWGIWTRKGWAYLAFPTAVILWLAEYWLERIFFQAPRANLIFMISVCLVLLAVTSIITYNRNTRQYFVKSEEHEQPDQDSASA